MDAEDSRGLVGEVRDLAGQYADNPDIALQLARALVILTVKGELQADETRHLVREFDNIVSPLPAEELAFAVATFSREPVDVAATTLEVRGIALDELGEEAAAYQLLDALSRPDSLQLNHRSRPSHEAGPIVAAGDCGGWDTISRRKSGWNLSDSWPQSWDICPQQPGR